MRLATCIVSYDPIMIGKRKRKPYLLQIFDAVHVEHDCIQINTGKPYSNSSSSQNMCPFHGKFSYHVLKSNMKNCNGTQHSPKSSNQRPLYFRNYREHQVQVKSSSTFSTIIASNAPFIVLLRETNAFLIW